MLYQCFFCIAFCIASLLVRQSLALNLPIVPSLEQFNNTLTTTNFTLSDSEKCTKDHRWLEPHYKQDDCKSALLLMYFEELSAGDARVDKEFVDRDTKSEILYQTVETPRKYIFST